MPLLQQIHFRIAFTFFYSLFGKYNHQGLLITQRCFHRCLGGKRHVKANYVIRLPLVVVCIYLTIQ